LAPFFDCRAFEADSNVLILPFFVCNTGNLTMATVYSGVVERINNNDFSADDSDRTILRNATPARLYQDAVEFDGGVITSSGAIATMSGKKTGRSPADKRIVDTADSRADVWWGDVNIALDPSSFSNLRAQAINYLNECPRLYVVDGYAGWDPKYQIKVRIICSRPYHALFMHNMLIRPTREQLNNFGKPDYVIYNAGQCAADRSIPGVTSDTSVSINFETHEMAILGTEYAGEMKKGVFTIMHYLMPKKEVFSMHCSANQGSDMDVSLFFGLSGTGKTTLSADPSRDLIGDDEHCWTDDGIFNIEGGCYAKCIGLSKQKEPEIWQAVKFGSVLENTVQDPVTHEVQYNDDSVTPNTRASYPIEYIPHARIPCVGGHPKNIIFLTCDAFGVLPPVSRLSSDQAKYHFISGYTAKVAGTEDGIVEPQTTFSACFGAAFLVFHPTHYARMLADRMHKHDADCWLVNTGWIGGGAHSFGKRIDLKYTRAIIDAIHDRSLSKQQYRTDPIFGLAIPKSCNGVPDEILIPSQCWTDADAYAEAARSLAQKFKDNFEKYSDQAADGTRNAGPKI
jgi:phosphoenolpyruvate carboxykinase (ATP)